MIRITSGLLAIAASFFLSGCFLVGPASLKVNHRPYNDSVVETLNEQLLLNLVRMKYRDNPYFIEIGSITTSQTIGGNAGGELLLPFHATGGRLGNPIADINYSSSPTISYTPLQGEDYSNKIMAPIPLEALLKLSQSGWSISRVFLIGVERANHLHNAPRASGPTPEDPPEFETFHQVAKALRMVQKKNAIDVVVDGGRVSFVFAPGRIPEDQQVALRRTMGLQPYGNIVTLTTQPSAHRDPDTIYLQARSIMGVLFFLSHNIEVPEADKQKNLVTVTRNPDGSEFDWNLVSGDLLRVHSSPTPPANAFVKIRYRNSFFYIEDTDLNSKSTFMLLNQLFSLQAGDIKRVAPVLTIPVSR